MILLAERTIAAPAPVVFDHLCDFPRFEQAARNRGAEVRRLGPISGAAPGASWEVKIPLMGGARTLKVDLVECTAPDLMRLVGQDKGIDAKLDVDLVEVSDSQSELSIRVEVAATTFSARLAVRALQVAQAKIEEKFRAGIGQFARGLEGRQS
jgi:hypothetical protein